MGALHFGNKVGEIHIIQPDALAALFEQFADQLNCVVLNACYSEAQARAIAQHIHQVIGMSHEIGDKAAIAFSIGFYQALGAGRTVEEAYKLGCVQIRLENIPEHLTPMLIKDHEVSGFISKAPLPSPSRESEVVELEGVTLYEEKVELTSSSESSAKKTRKDWGDVPDIPTFWGHV